MKSLQMKPDAVKRAAVFALSLLLLSGLNFSACSSTPKIAYAAGKYTATVQGFGGPVTVSMTFSKNAIIEAKIEGEQETAEIGGRALEPLARQIMESQSAEIDGVSGATYTSEAVRLAASNCINQARRTSQTGAATLRAPLKTAILSLHFGLFRGYRRFSG